MEIKGFKVVYLPMQVDCIYRFRGKDITTYIQECLFSMFVNDRKLFDSHYTQVSKSLVDTEIFLYCDFIVSAI
ncbi:hypothetical protein EAG08_01875 [Chryseobacterium sp. 3008163]|nr:hypothetical protein EAG08_01875 [Chryseobacterium sp. 3008163]